MKMTKHEFSAATQYQLLLAGDWSGENVFTIPRITFHCLKFILHHDYCGHNVVVLIWVQALAQAGSLAQVDALALWQQAIVNTLSPAC